MKLWGKEWTRQEIMEYVGSITQIGGTRAFEMSDGWERGNRCLEVRNGDGLSFHVSLDRGLDISQAEYKGIPLAWRSPNGDVAPPYYNAEGSAWLRGFPGGLFVTGGLTYFGSVCEDEGVTLGLHGRISNSPASKVWVEEEWIQNDYMIKIRGEVRESTLYGENLKLIREIRIMMGEPNIHIKDVVVNEGFHPSPHMMLYHFNLGFPLISEHSRIEVKAADSKVILDTEKKGLEQWDTFGIPNAHYNDQIICHFPETNESGWGECAVINPDLLEGKGLRVKIKFCLDQLPYLYNWKVCSRGVYLLGVEPANCLGINGRKEARENGTLRILQPGESVTYEVVLCMEEK